MKKKLLLVFVLLILIASGFAFLYWSISNQTFDAYLAGETPLVSIVDKEGNSFEKARGTVIEVKQKTVKLNDIEGYNVCFEDGQEGFVPLDAVADDLRNVVKEKALFVNLPCSILNMDDHTVIGLLLPGTKVEIVDYGTLNDEGIVDYYIINDGTLKGRVYSKYLSLNEELPTVPDVHLSRDDIYGGGSAKDLVYSLETKAQFKDNIMPEHCNTLYLNASSLANIDAYIDFALNNNINSFVIDIRDSHIPTYASEVMAEYSPTTYENAVMSYEDFAVAIKKAKDAGLYLIGRITVFKDTNYAIDHPENAIKDLTTGESLYFNSSYWSSPFKRDVWSYNVALALEVVKDFGINEIQFEYCRFPDHIDLMEARGEIDLFNDYNESKAQAIQRFIMYAADELHQAGAYTSVDVFGETSNAYVTAYGQYWPAISNYVDVISAMPYPDHFGIHDYGISSAVWEVPYELLSFWRNNKKKRQSETPSPAKVRTWIQGYDSLKEPYVEYDADKIVEQISALYEQGLDDGFIIWNAASNLERYQSYASAFNQFPQ